MADQAKAARALTEIYLSLDEKHRDAVRAIITGRFKDILTSAEGSWQRFCDSMHFIRPVTHQIQTARSDFEKHADQFKHTLQKFVTMAGEITE